MNENHSGKELLYKHRWLAPQLVKSAKEYPITFLTGARKVGKRTLFQQEKSFSHCLKIDLDDLDILEQAERDPAYLWKGAKEVIIAEVQRVPRLLYVVKQEVDNTPHQKRFVLSGSADLLLMRQLSEAMAGKAICLSLPPMGLGEIKGRVPPKWFFKLFNGTLPSIGELKEVTSENIPNNIPNLMLRGFMPPLMDLESPEDWLKWWEHYVAIYVERDLRQISQIDSLTDFRRVMGTLALRSGQVLNQTEVARESGVSQPTVYRYINVLTTSCLLKRLPAFGVSCSKRLTKSPKVFWLDPGLSAFLMGYHDQESISCARGLPGLFETLVFLHLRTLGQLITPHLKLYYWRTVTGREVSFVIKWGRKIIAVEIKLTTEPCHEDSTNLKLFLKEYPETAFCLMVHNGSTIKMLHEKILAIPWSALAFDL